MSRPTLLNENGKTYDLVQTNGNISIRCRNCGQTSHDPKDIKEKYCQWCNQSHEQMLATNPRAIREARYKEKWDKVISTTPGYRNRSMSATVKNPENV